MPVAFINLEAFKGHAYPDVLLSVLIKTLDAFDKWLCTAGSHPISNVSFWQKYFGRTPTEKPLKKEKVNALLVKLRNEIKLLNTLLHSDDDAELTQKSGSKQNSKQAHSEDLSGNLTSTVKVPGASQQASLEAKVHSDSNAGYEQSVESTEATKRNKGNVLHRKIIDFQELFSEMVELSGADAFIFLDDLYHLRKSDQANVIDYFHRIVKDRSVWLKVGTIKHRTDWYRHGDPPVGMKLGDDCDYIDLDVTLEKYEIAKAFLLQILNQLITEAGAGVPENILTEGGMDRLVLACGGVARDFLTIFRRSIEVARERGVTYRGDRITAEDVNLAAGEHDPTKRDELRRDTLEERATLEATLAKIQDFCIQKSVNCFLVEQGTSNERQSLDELVDLRFVHIVKGRTTVRTEQSKLYTAYMLDISQYTGERSRRELIMVPFWKSVEMDKIRQKKYVLSLQ